MERHFKLVLKGSSMSGKTSIVKRIMKEDFDIRDYRETFVANYQGKNVEVNGKNVIIDICDTPGNERLKSYCMMCVRGAHFVVYVFDLTSQESFERILKTI